MKTFKDAEERTWNIVVNVGTARLVKDLLSVDIFKLHIEEAKRVFDDPCLLVDVLYVLCKEQADKREITDVQFGQAMHGDCLYTASQALLGEVADFFPSTRGKILRAQMDKTQELTAAMEQQALDKIAAIDLISLQSFIKSPESLESIPTPTP